MRGMRSRLLRPKSMPLNTLVNARDGSSRVVLSEPSGSYAEVFTLSILFIYLVTMRLICLLC